MKKVFVLTLKSTVDPDHDSAAGYLEDVCSGREIKFQSISALIAVLAQLSVAEAGEEASATPP